MSNLQVTLNINLVSGSALLNLPLFGIYFYKYSINGGSLMLPPTGSSQALFIDNRFAPSPGPSGTLGPSPGPSGTLGPSLFNINVSNKTYVADNGNIRYRFDVPWAGLVRIETDGIVDAYWYSIDLVNGIISLTGNGTIRMGDSLTYIGPTQFRSNLDGKIFTLQP